MFGAVMRSRHGRGAGMGIAAAILYGSIRPTETEPKWNWGTPVPPVTAQELEKQNDESSNLIVEFQNRVGELTRNYDGLKNNSSTEDEVGELKEKIENQAKKSKEIEEDYKHKIEFEDKKITGEFTKN